MKKLAILLLSIAIIVVFSINIFKPVNLSSSVVNPRDELIEHDFNPIETFQVTTGNYYSYTELRNNMNNSSNMLNYLTNDIKNEYIIRFDTAEELYRFSIDLSYNIKYGLETTKLSLAVQQELASLHYVLGADINYLDVQSNRFIPIGFNFKLEEEDINYTTLKFTGTFDGRGFEISNLYATGYDQLTIEHGEQEETLIDIALTEYYSMFAYNSGTIKNVGLVDPTFELRDAHDNLKKAAFLVGLNEGIVSNVFVRDLRNQANAGFRMRTFGLGQAAGIVFENGLNGQFENAYYAGRTVVNQTYINNFNTQVEPVIFDNSKGQINNVYHVSTELIGGVNTNVYLSQLTVNDVTFQIKSPLNSTAKTAEQIKSSTTSGLDNFYYYPEDRYPALFGLEYDNNLAGFKITNALELIFFTKMIATNSSYNGKQFRASNYYIVNDINMQEGIKPNLYKTPAINFTGELIGLQTEVVINNETVLRNAYINHLNLNTGVVIGGNYYVGFFGVLRGKISNITFSDYKINITNTDNYVGTHMFVGGVTGSLENGEINNVSLDLNVNLGNKAIGGLSFGSIAGQASGLIQKVYNHAGSSIELGASHLGTTIVGSYSYVGGIVGRVGNTKLEMYDALNKANINGLGTSSNVTPADDSIIYTGGVIGYVVNTFDVRHDFGLITNEGDINIKNYRSNLTSTQYVSGVIGYSAGYGYELNLKSGLWTNNGLLNLNHRGSNTIYASGIVVSDHEHENEFIYLNNKKGFTVNNYTNFNYTTLVYHINTGNVTISQSKNSANVEFINSGFSNKYSGVYHSKITSGHSTLRYVENNGNITMSNFSTDLNFNVAGITTAENVNFLNVSYKGKISVYNVTFNPATSSVPTDASPSATLVNNANNYNETTNQTNRNIWIAGITTTLSKGKYIKNSYNEGEIKVGNVNATQNVYIAGIVNRNLSGDLDLLPSNYSQPKATVGVINTVNYADILSTFDDDNHGFLGQSNVYVGGITTLNEGSIQDVANTGNLHIVHRETYNSRNVYFDNDTLRAGRTGIFRGGVVLGGISAANTKGTARIYDTVNSGEIIAISNHFARAGGILGTVLAPEFFAGKNHSDYYESLFTELQKSVLSNGMNYGPVSAITQEISWYNTTNHSGTQAIYANINNWDVTPGTVGSTFNMNSRQGTVERIGIYGSAGGVIGNGLSVMKRMLNHGEISSSETAGGVVGSTFVYSEDFITYVNMNTAINYGEIQAVKTKDNSSSQTNSFASIEKIDITYENIKEFFYNQNNGDFETFVNPTARNVGSNNEINPNENRLRRHPESKRGFGGIFGRLQRGGNQVMTTVAPENSGIEASFDFIVNMNPNIDLIGRLDQNYNFTWSGTAFKFYGAKFYSAKENDITQAVFTGVEFSGSHSRTKSDIEYNYQISSLSRGRFQLQRRSRTQLTTESYEELYHQIGERAYLLETSNIESTSGSWSGWGVWDNFGSIVTARPTLPENHIEYGDFTSWIYTYSYIKVKEVPFVSENQNNQNAQFVYDPDFEMMKNDTILTTGEPISSYIYHVHQEVLSDNLYEGHDNGLYVLASSSGSNFGAALPANITISKLRNFSQYLPYNINYLNTQTFKKDLSENAIEKYMDLFQTKINDKSELLDDENQSIQIKNDELIINNQNSIVSGNNSTIDHDNKVITLKLNSNQINTGVNKIVYEMTKALIPANAITAKRIEDIYPDKTLDTLTESEITALRNDLINEGNRSFAQAANLKKNFDLSNFDVGIHDIGYFTSYSEASRYSNELFKIPEFQTTYLLRIEVYTNTSLPLLSSYHIDSGNQINYGADDATRRSNNINIPGSADTSIRIRFTSGTSYLSEGYQIGDYLQLQYLHNGTYYNVDQEYYQLSTIPMDSSGNFEFTYTFSPLLRGGSYRIVYKYSHYGTDGIAPNNERYINFTKGTSSSKAITAVSHYSQPVINVSGTTIATNVNFGVDILNATNSTNFASVPNATKPYLDYVSHNINYLNVIRLSPFARIINVEELSTTISNGYKTYNVAITIEAENGTNNTITHQIVERTISAKDFYVDNIKVSESALEAAREAEETKFSIGYGIDQLVANSIYSFDENNPEGYFKTSITAVDFNNQTIPTDNIIGIEFDASSLLDIYMSEQTIPGTYTIAVTYVRPDGNIELGSFVIKKLQGTDPYIRDIQFADNAQDTDYPEIGIAVGKNSDSLYNVNSNQLYGGIFLPQDTNNPHPVLGSFYAGIFYNGAKPDYRYFRVNGIVSNIPFYDYSPILLSNLAPGGSISRRVFDYEEIDSSKVTVDPDGTKWTIFIGENSSEADKLLLNTDYTLMNSGLEAEEDEEVIITYRTKAEINTTNDESQMVYYHITVVDRIFNFSVRFDVLYANTSEDDPTKLELVSGNLWKNKTILIQITNFLATNNNNNELIPIITPANDPLVKSENINYHSVVSNLNIFYSAIGEEYYRYLVGRNRSGFYDFKVLDPTNELGKTFEYVIFEKNASDPLEKSPLDGYYYYIQDGSKNRTRSFEIIILGEGLTKEKFYGLYDYNRTWD